jgi:hypothetical protein
MALIHDDDLGRIDGIGENSVSADLIDGYIVHSIMLLVTGNPSTRHGNGPPTEFQHSNT